MLSQQERNDLRVELNKILVTECLRSGVLTESKLKHVTNHIVNKLTYEQCLNMVFNPEYPNHITDASLLEQLSLIHISEPTRPY